MELPLEAVVHPKHNSRGGSSRYYWSPHVSSCSEEPGLSGNVLTFTRRFPVRLNGPDPEPIEVDGSLPTGFTGLGIQFRDRRTHFNKADSRRQSLVLGYVHAFITAGCCVCVTES